MNIQETLSVTYIQELFAISGRLNGGVLYLVVLVTKNADKRLYAKILLFIDIKQIIKGKEEQNSVTVHLESVENTNRLVQLCDLFSQNKAK